VKLKLVSTILALTIISISIQPAFAGIDFSYDVRCLAPQVGCDAVSSVDDVENNILTPLGMNTGDESLTLIFNTPEPLPPPADPTTLEDVTFYFMRDTGIFEFSFGFCPVASVGANPVTQPQLFAEQCLGSAIEVFDDSGVDPGTPPPAPPGPPFATAAQLLSGDIFVFDKDVNPLAQGVPSYFYLLPDNNLSFFLANSDEFYMGSPLNSLRAPLFSNNFANPGEFDQMLGFSGNCVTPPPFNFDQCTIFMFEDLTRDGLSDEDFTDLAFLVDAIFEDVDPCTLPNPPPQLCLGGEFLEVDSSALLLAGLQTSSAWILPIVIAGAGAGIAAFQLRRK